MLEHSDRQISITPSAAEVIEARSDNGLLNVAADCLAHAFFDDPVIRFIFPDPVNRLRRTHSLYQMVLPGYARHGHIYLHRDQLAAAVWQKPQPLPVGFWQQCIDTLLALGHLRGAIGRGFAVQETMRAAKPAQPYWYLAMLGSHPAGRGSGAAKSLVQTALATCDRDGMPAYLESSNPDNIGYYQQFGFQVTEQLQIPNGPPLWGMWRE